MAACGAWRTRSQINGAKSKLLFEEGLFDNKHNIVAIIVTFTVSVNL